MADEPRVRVAEHELIWMAVSRGECECGMKFELDEDAKAGRSPASMRDMVMDAHSAHISVIKKRTRKEK